MPLATLSILTRAATKAAGATLRSWGGTRTHPDWIARAEVCERCPLRVVRRGASYCGNPLLDQLHREPIDGCGCPTVAKAKAPSEHCPLTSAHLEASHDELACDCKWCEINADGK